MLGELEQVVLLGILRVGDDAYGVPILREIERQTGRDLTLATIYKTLSRLEEKGLVASEVGEPTPTRGGRAKKYYTVTRDGKHALRDAVGAFRNMTRGLSLGLESK